MNKVTVNADLLFELKSKQEWIARVPYCLPQKTEPGETWIWVDINGNVFNRGADFTAAESSGSFPCCVYKLQCADVAYRATAKAPEEATA